MQNEKNGNVFLKVTEYFNQLAYSGALPGFC